MANIDWEKLDISEVPALLEEINEYIKPVPFNVDSTTIRKYKLNFYPKYKFLELTDLSAVPTVRKYVIYKKGDVNVINWTNEIIYSINEKAPVKLTATNIGEYIRFFFNYVRGRHGRFVVIEDIEEIHWKVEPPAQGRKAIQDILQPIKLLEEDGEGNFTIEVFMLFKDSLFKAKAYITADGMVSLSDEELKIEGMPIVQDMVAE